MSVTYGLKADKKLVTAKLHIHTVVLSILHTNLTYKISENSCSTAAHAKSSTVEDPHSNLTRRKEGSFSCSCEGFWKAFLSTGKLP